MSNLLGFSKRRRKPSTQPATLSKSSVHRLPAGRNQIFAVIDQPKVTDRYHYGYDYDANVKKEKLLVSSEEKKMRKRILRIS